jgi:hypothetical protein
MADNDIGDGSGRINEGAGGPWRSGAMPRAVRGPVISRGGTPKLHRLIAYLVTFPKPVHRR